MKPLRLTRLKVIIVIITVLLIYNEWITFILKSYTWPKIISDGDEEAVKFLIVADPQILSIQSEPNFPFNYVAVWDANRFVSRTFQLGLSFSQPDVIVFLGDLLNDGSVCNNEQFKELVYKFHSLLQIPESIKVFYLPGDNDIGGEGYDEVSQNKIERFNAAFNTSNPMTSKFVQLYHLNAIPGASQGPLETRLGSLHKSLDDTFRILFSHLPLIPGVKKSLMEQVNQINPSVIFSAHDHDSYKFIGKKANPKADQFWLLRDEGKVWDIDLKSNELHEICVPTCSYRMGKDKYGFGFALVNKSGIMKYTVLWLPGRFSQLWCYFWGLCLCISLLVYPFVLHISGRLGNFKSTTTIPKYHRV